MEKIPEKEILFNRYYYGEMDKQELTEPVKQLLLDKELREWFTVQMEFILALRDPRPPAYSVQLKIHRPQRCHI